MIEEIHKNIGFNFPKILRQIIQGTAREAIEAVKEYVVNEKDAKAKIIKSNWTQPNYEILGYGSTGLENLDEFLVFGTEIKEEYKKRVRNSHVTGEKGIGRFLGLKFCSELVFSFNCARPVKNSENKDIHAVRITFKKVSNGPDFDITEPTIEIDERPDAFLSRQGGKVEMIDVDRVYFKEFDRLGKELADTFAYALLTGELTIYHNLQSIQAPSWYRKVYEYNGHELTEYDGQKFGKIRYATMPCDSIGEWRFFQNGILVVKIPFPNNKFNAFSNVGNKITLMFDRGDYEYSTPEGIELTKFIEDKAQQFEHISQNKPKIAINKTTRSLNSCLEDFFGRYIQNMRLGQSNDLNLHGNAERVERLFKGQSEQEVIGIPKRTQENGYVSDKGDVDGGIVTHKFEHTPRPTTKVILDPYIDTKVQVTEILQSETGKQYQVVTKNVKRGAKHGYKYKLKIVPNENIDPEIYVRFLNIQIPTIFESMKNKIHSEIFDDRGNFRKGRESAMNFSMWISNAIVDVLHPDITLQDRTKIKQEMYVGLLAMIRRRVN